MLVLGTIGLDLVETPFGSGSDLLGGSAVYISLAARIFVDDVRMVGIVGGDFPAPYRKLLEESGIDLAGLETDPAGKTFRWAGRYHYDLQDRETLATDLNVLETFDPVLPQSYRDSQVVCLGNLDPALQRKVLEQIDRPRFVVCDTMNFWIEHTWDSLLETLRLVDCLVINEAEARQLADDPNLIRAARKIRAMGPDTLVIKKGEHGALLFMNGGMFSAPAYPLEDIRDPTGAGDTFAGGLAGYLERAGTFSRDALIHGVVYGSAVASFCVERFGPQRLEEITVEDVEERVDVFRALARIPLHVTG